MRQFLLVMLLTMTFSWSALAQQAPVLAPQPPAGSPPASAVPLQPPVAPPTSPASLPNGPIIVNLPNPIKIESTAAGGGSGSGSSWLTFFGVIVTAGVSGWAGFKTAQGAEESRSLTRELAIKEREIKVELARLELETKIDHFEKDREDKRRQSDSALASAAMAEDNKMSIEENRIKIELQRLGFQSGNADNDAYLAATRFVHEQQIAEAELIRSFSDRLLSDNERDSTFAIFVLSAYVSPQVIERMAAGGEKIISTASLEQLSKIEGYQIASTAKLILARRKLSQNNNNKTPIS